VATGQRLELRDRAAASPRRARDHREAGGASCPRSIGRRHERGRELRLDVSCRRAARRVSGAGLRRTAADHRRAVDGRFDNAASPAVRGSTAWWRSRTPPRSEARHARAEMARSGVRSTRRHEAPQRSLLRVRESVDRLASASRRIALRQLDPRLANSVMRRVWPRGDCA
jgi:hypothetical protein